jgi:hypothetical protein
MYHRNLPKNKILLRSAPPTIMGRSQLFPLCSVPDGADNNPPTTYAVQNNIGSAANDQLADSRLGSGPAQAGMVSESFYESDDSHGQPLRGIRLVPRHVSANLLKPRPRQGRPDDLYRHSGPSSCSSPQTHLGSGNSWSVPQERSQAFMSSCRM